MLALNLILFVFQQAGDPPEVKYNVGFIAAGAAIAGALISGGITIANSIMSANKQKALETLKSDLLAETQSRIESLKADLAQEGKERDARRDYEYDAHKRLYAQCEPLLFQLAELAEHAYHRIYSLARTARKGKLPDWLGNNTGYYMRSTMYKLICPLVIYRLIQQRLTFVDLTLDVHIANQYRLMKFLYLTFTDSFDFASIKPLVDYEPDVKDWESKRQENEPKHWRQGLYLGLLDNLIDDLIVESESDKVRWKSYGEFESEFATEESALRNHFAAFADILHGFHPKNRPVLWRMLWTQTLIYKQIVESQTSSATKSRVGLAAVSPKLPAGSLDWRRTPDEGADQEGPSKKASDEEVLLIPQQVAMEYLQVRLPEVFGLPGEAKKV